MSDRLRKQVSLELEQIDRLHAAHRPLLERRKGVGQFRQNPSCR